MALEKVMDNISQIQIYNNKERKLGESTPKHFDAIILDLNMPIMDGF